MQIKTIAMMAVAGCAIGMLTGCGVPQKEYDAMVAKLTTEKTDMESSLNATIAEKDSELSSEKAKTRKLQIDLNDAVERIKELNDNNSGLQSAADDLKNQISTLQSALASAKADIAAAEADKEDLRNQCTALEMDAQEAQRRFDMLRKAILELNKTNPDDLAIQLNTIVEQNEMGGGEMGGMMQETQKQAPQSQPAPSSLSNLLQEMGEM